jgi:dTMP kinase
MFICVEGIDRAGKTTAVDSLYNRLNGENHSVAKLRFPDRNSEIGKVINIVLSNRGNVMDNSATYLLFAADRYNKMQTYDKDMKDKNFVLCDRYSLSGIVYGAANGVDRKMCIEVESRLRKPDIIFYLDIHPVIAAKRSGYGEEKFETLQFQYKVYEEYKKLIAGGWPNVVVIDATRSQQEISDIMYEHIMKKNNNEISSNSNYIESN